MRIREAKKLAKQGLKLEQILNFILLAILSILIISITSVVTMILITAGGGTSIADIALSVPLMIVSMITISVMGQEMAMLNAKYCRPVSVGEIFKNFNLVKYFKVMIVQFIVLVLPSLLMSAYYMILNFMSTNNTVRVEIDETSLAVITTFLVYIFPIKFMFAPYLCLDDPSRGIFGSIGKSWKITRFFKYILFILSFIPGILFPLIVLMILAVTEQLIAFVLVAFLVTVYWVLYLIPYINISTFHLMYQALDAEENKKRGVSNAKEKKEKKEEDNING